MEAGAEIGRMKQGLSASPFFVAMLLVAVAQAVAQDTPAGATPTRHRRIIVSVPDRRLALVEDGHVLRIYMVAVGAPISPSPAGEFKVVSRLSNPTYYYPGVVIPPGRNNPLGTRWIGLDRRGYGIHGTNEPRSIGKAASHGCIRMAKTDLEQLFDEVQVGDVVEIRAHADAESAAIFGSRVRRTTTAQVAVPAAASGM